LLALFTTECRSRYSEQVAHPCLAFCPYLPVHKVIEFGDWELGLGPVDAFEDRWADPKFKEQSKAFLAKFVDHAGKPIEKPSLFCRRGGQIDGQVPSAEEIEALETAIGFTFLDENPRRGNDARQQAWNVLTADNTEPFFWPIDVDAGYVTVTTGLMVRTLGGGYRISDAELVIKPPLDLHMPLRSQSADSMCLEAVYRTVCAPSSRSRLCSLGIRIFGDRRVGARSRPPVRNWRLAAAENHQPRLLPDGFVRAH
jgi:hypothetical protein